MSERFLPDKAIDALDEAGSRVHISNIVVPKEITDVEQKLQDITRKYFAARQMGSRDLLTQLSTFVTIYRDEMSRRYMKKNKGDLDRDLDKLINVN
jgi:ATP-dependent Clp protease ATP-binding subunit ClpA